MATARNHSAITPTDGLAIYADALLGFTADYEAFCQTLGLAPEPEIEDAA